MEGEGEVADQEVVGDDKGVEELADGTEAEGCSGVRLLSVVALEAIWCLVDGITLVTVGDSKLLVLLPLLLFGEFGVWGGVPTTPVLNSIAVSSGDRSGLEIERRCRVIPLLLLPRLPPAFLLLVGESADFVTDNLGMLELVWLLLLLLLLDVFLLLLLVGGLLE